MRMPLEKSKDTYGYFPVTILRYMRYYTKERTMEGMPEISDFVERA